MLRLTAAEENKIRHKLDHLYTSVEVVTGEKVLQLFSDENFLLAWENIYRACPWATVFQSPTFVTTWYTTYQKEYMPVMVLGKCSGKITGMLHLAQSKSGIITGAGEELAEYHVWITNNTTDDFIEDALKKIYHDFKGCRIQLKYIPATTALEWTKNNHFFKQHGFLKDFRQPLLKLDPIHLEKELKKKNRKEKINRLKRIGEFEFEQVTDDGRLNSIIDELSAQFDFRKGAMYNALFFLNDPYRKIFLLKLFRKGIVHVSLLKLNGAIIASNASIFGKGWVHLQGLNTHTPSYAKYSPGILHFLMLGQHLAKHDFSIFDLTPGDDPYKNILATHSITSYKLIIDKPFKKLTYTLKNNIVKNFKKVLIRFNISPVKLKWKYLFYSDKLTNRIKKGLTPSKIKHLIYPRLFDRYKLFFLKKEAISFHVEINNLKKDCLEDLLLYKTNRHGMTRWEFLKDALHRFEDRQSCYTYSEPGKLLFCVWVYKQQQKEAIKDSKDNPILSGSQVLDGFYYHPYSIKVLKNYISAVLTTTFQNGDIRAIYAKVKVHDKDFVDILQSIGFKLY